MLGLYGNMFYTSFAWFRQNCLICVYPLSPLECIHNRWCATLTKATCWQGAIWMPLGELGLDMVVYDLRCCRCPGKPFRFPIPPATKLCVPVPQHSNSTSNPTCPSSLHWLIIIDSAFQSDLFPSNLIQHNPHWSAAQAKHLDPGELLNSC